MTKQFIFWIIVLFTATIYAQKQKLSGIVTNAKAEPLEFVAVFIPETNISTYTNQKGEFNIQLPTNSSEIVISLLGYQTKKINSSSLKRKNNIKIVLEEDLLELDEIIVTAKKTVSKEASTVYKIESQAIKQVQAFNLSDVLGLLPGNKVRNPNLTSKQTTNLRTAINSDVNSFGTAIIVDGITMSNDANFQAENPNASFAGGNASVANGVDLRTISLANVGSIEVVSGIASPKYGNLSSGGVIVKSKVGTSPYIVNTNINNTNYQASIAKGYDLEKAGVLNSDFSYAYSSGSPTERKLYYQTFNLGLRWKLPEFEKLKWNHFTLFRVIYSDDGNRHEPDEVFRNETDVKSTMFQVGFSGDFKLENFLNSNISYNFNGSLTNQHSFFKKTETNGPFPIIEAQQTGTYTTTFSPLMYDLTTTIDGQPINLSAQVNASQFVEKNSFDFNFETGLQYTYDANKGNGRTSSGGVARNVELIGSRAVTFNEIPASKTFSAYHQTRIKKTNENSKQQLNLGIRYDNMLQRYNLWSPRLSFNSKHGNFTGRVAWGKSYKAPAMIQLYPSKTYIDLINLSYYANNPNERIAVVTTYVNEPKNTQLKPNFTNLTEIGFDWSSSFLNLQLTYFYKELQRGITHSNELLLLPLQKWEVVNAPQNQQPTVAPIAGSVNNIPRVINEMGNSYFVNTNGIELIIGGLKINKTNTEFNFRYSYLNSLRTNLEKNIERSGFVVGNNSARFGVYENSKLRAIKSFGTLTLIQHIPSLRFIVTLSTELNFKDYRINENASQYPYAYYDINGRFFELTPTQQTSPEFADLVKNTRVFTPTQTPFFTNFNLQVRKETKQGHSFSFFANNAPWYNPEYNNNGTRAQLNDKLQVGFGASFIIK